jgi:hypothetical protein
MVRCSTKVCRKNGRHKNSCRAEVLFVACKY